MKSTMPYLGVTAPKLRATCKQLFASYPFESAEAWRTDVLEVWRTATDDKRARPFQTLEALPMCVELITTGAWRDYVDEIASNRVGPLLEAFPKPMTSSMKAWSTCENMWKRRTSIICQLGFGAETDVELLYACITPSITSKEFFLRKASGGRCASTHTPIRRR